MKKILIILFFCLINSIAQGKTYYIDPSGNDISGTGSINSPWKSLYKACLVAKKPGDIIHINKGTYCETKECVLAVGVSIEGTGNTSVITRTPSAEWTGIIMAQSPEGTNGNQHISNIKFDGAKQTIAQAIWITGRSNFSIHDCTFSDFNYLAVYWAGRNDQILGSPAQYATGNKFFNNIVINCAAYSGGYARGALYLGGQDGMLIYSNYINQSGRKPGTNGWPIKMWCNEGYMRGCKIFDNTIYKDDVSNWDFAIEGIWFSGVEIYGNNITGSIDINHSSKGKYEYGLYIHNNTIGPPAFQEKTFAGIWCEFDNDNVIIKYNRIKNCAMGIAFTPRKGNAVNNFEISYNLFENCGQNNNSHYYSAIRFLYTSEEPPFYQINNLNIYNNVFFANQSQNPWFGIALGGFTSAKNINIINNVFVNFYSNFIMSHQANFIDGLTIRNNILYNNGGHNDPKFVGKPKNYIWSGNMKSNPGFYSTTNFHLNYQSPANDGGFPIASLTMDYEGVPVGNPPCIGAFETSALQANPVFLESIVLNTDPKIIEIIYDQPLRNVAPALQSFNIKVNSIKRDIKAISIEETKVRLTLSVPVKSGEAVSVEYTKPAENPLQSSKGKEATGLGLKWVYNSLSL